MQLEVKTMAELSEKNITPDFLYWVGSAGSFDDRAKKITRAFVKVLNYANVSFGVLGVEESTSGDVAKRAGNEFLFQMQALANIEVMNSYNIKKIITTCPHSFNILKNEYPDLGGNYEVYHHSEFVHDLIESKKITISQNSIEEVMTYHDPCYLGRGNNIYNQPREIIKRLSKNFIEMPRNKRNSLCCGAGGAQMFKEAEKGSAEINIVRTQEALDTKSKIIVTGCPFCNTMMSDGVKNINEGAALVKDIAEVVAESLI
jgi:Fe-S oxidoreductase|tara:strand:- start:3496 stop:4272 length:777 start_codon:yes stop_codon:yes gene_type:complete